MPSVAKQRCGVCELILDELCRSRRTADICDLSLAYKEGTVDEEEIVSKLKAMVTQEDITRAKCMLVSSGKLTADEAGVQPHTCQST